MRWIPCGTYSDSVLFAHHFEMVYCKKAPAYEHALLFYMLYTLHLCCFLFVCSPNYAGVSREQSSYCRGSSAQANEIKSDHWVSVQIVKLVAIDMHVIPAPTICNTWCVSYVWGHIIVWRRFGFRFVTRGIGWCVLQLLQSACEYGHKSSFYGSCESPHDSSWLADGICTYVYLQLYIVMWKSQGLLKPATYIFQFMQYGDFCVKECFDTFRISLNNWLLKWSIVSAGQIHAKSSSPTGMCFSAKFDPKQDN